GMRAHTRQDRVRHPNARLVPRPAAPAADGHLERGRDRRHGHLLLARNPLPDTRSYGEENQCRIPPMGPADAFSVDEEMEGGSSSRSAKDAGRSLRYQLIVALIAALVFLGCIIPPPSLMDDVDAVQGQIARNMLQSGDWVTARLDGVAYLEKSPLKYWMIAVSFAIFGPHDWAARLPVALSAVLLCWVVTRFAAWAFGWRTALYAGVAMATSIGLFLFTRILIPDVILTLTITIGLWSLMRTLDPEEAHPVAWAYGMWAAMGTGLLLKGLIAAAFPVAIGVIYVSITRQWGQWRRLRPFSGIALLLL